MPINIELEDKLYLKTDKVIEKRNLNKMRTPLASQWNGANRHFLYLAEISLQTDMILTFRITIDGSKQLLLVPILKSRQRDASVIHSALW